MKTKVLASAAALAGAGALLAGPGLAAPSPSFSGGAHFGGGMSGGAHMSGGGHFGGSGHFAPSGRSGAWRGGTWSGSGWGGHHHHFINVFYIDPGFGFWDPFFWGDWGYFGGYDMVPYWDESSDGYAPPPDSAAPPGYDCDGWRWDAQQQRYLPAKVACQ